jgi:hypothetical protein
LAQSGHWYALFSFLLLPASYSLDPYFITGDGCSVRVPCVCFRRAARRELSTDLNLPICVFNATLVLLFMRLKTPPATLNEKLSKIDFM